MKVNNYPFTFVGILLVIVGWFSIVTGIFGFFKAEDLLVVTFQLESMLVDKTFVPASQIWWHMVLRIFLGFLIILIGNAFLERGVHGKHAWMHPHWHDIRRLA